MRLKEIQVSGLFGVFDHRIPLRLEERITIIHGPNGFGKTALLLLVQSLLGNNFAKLRRIPFKSFALLMEDGRRVSVSKKLLEPSDSERDDPANPLQFAYEDPSHTRHEFKLEFPLYKGGVGIPLQMIEQQIDDLDRVGPELWINSRTGQQLGLEEVIETYGHLLPGGALNRKKPLPEWLSSLPSQLDVRLIEAQRLLNVSDSRRVRRGAHTSGSSGVFGPTVSTYSRELAANIQEVQAKYGTYSQQLDSTFPTRVIQSGPSDFLTVHDLKAKLEDLHNRRQRIIAAGLLTEDQHPGPLFDPQKQVDETARGILSLYSEDVARKLNVFNDITAKIELFKELINKRFSYKRVDIERQSGFQLTTSAGLPLLPTDLSSGEQHELVLLYELLFKTKPNSLILIDEPELSLHVAWQVEFLNDLANVIKLAPFDVLLATHSPQIINDRWALTEELKGPENAG